MDLHSANLLFPLDMGHLYCWSALLKIRQYLFGSPWDGFRRLRGVATDVSAVQTEAVRLVLHL